MECLLLELVLIMEGTKKERKKERTKRTYRYGFNEFTHHRTVMKQGTWLNPRARFPPYNDATVDLVRKLIVGPLIPPMLKTLLKVGGNKERKKERKKERIDC